MDFDPLCRFLFFQFVGRGREILNKIMIDGSKKGTSFLSQNVVKKDRKKIVCRKVLFQKKMFAEVHTKKVCRGKFFIPPPSPSRKIMVHP